ncbi:diglucosyl diacylglycerol synthase [Sutcliffiella sp. NPDC057660]|uniref:diglucosyl diacylglycerol synthase n=1 Tax=Sutcliffiella sp. NPDC057660 TaxID=3346199 RepID=UPI0036A00E0B
MHNNPKILILTAAYGNGHLQVAHSLQQTCISKGITDVTICNLYSESHPVVTEVTEKLYKKSFTVGKQMYRLFYYGTNKVYDKKLWGWYAYYGLNRLSLLIDEMQPDILINTFPIHAVPEFRKKTGIVIPTFTILTDFCLHRLWLHSEVDKYYVATPSLKEELLKLNIHDKKIMVSGIPIRSNFEYHPPLEPIIEKYKIDRNTKLLLILAGAHGVLKDIYKICEDILSTTNYQILVVCGNNKMLQKELKAFESLHPAKFQSHGFVERIDELYRIADCIVTKPGGITLSEICAIGTPVILYKPVPGQEKENAFFFQEESAAIMVEKKDRLLEAVYMLLEDNNLQQVMKGSLQNLHLPYASNTIINDILEESEKIVHDCAWRKTV